MAMLPHDEHGEVFDPVEDLDAQLEPTRPISLNDPARETAIAAALAL